MTQTLTLNLVQAVNEALSVAMGADPEVVLLGEERRARGKEEQHFTAAPVSEGAAFALRTSANWLPGQRSRRERHLPSCFTETRHSPAGVHLKNSWRRCASPLRWSPCSE